MTDAELTRLLAIIGAVTGIIGTVAGLAAIGWDFYKWRYSERVRLKVTANPNFLFYHPGLPDHMQPKDNLLAVSVTNIGKIPTTVKFVSFHGFNSKSAMRKRNGEEMSFAMTPKYAELPAKLAHGDDWTGFFLQDGLETYLKYEYFVVQIEDSMSEFPFRAIVDKQSMVKKTKR
jgi:hypothetical protein